MRIKVSNLLFICWKYVYCACAPISSIPNAILSIRFSTFNRLNYLCKILLAIYPFRISSTESILNGPIYGHEQSRVAVVMMSHDWAWFSSIYLYIICLCTHMFMHWCVDDSNIHQYDTQNNPLKWRSLR